MGGRGGLVWPLGVVTGIAKGWGRQNERARDGWDG